MRKNYYEEERSLPVKYAVLASIVLFGVGFVFGSISSGSSYNTECGDLLEPREIKYTGSIDEYSTPSLSNDLFFSSDSDRGGVFLMDSDKLGVKNGSKLDFEFTQKLLIGCSDGRITVDTYFTDEKVVDSGENGGDSSGE